MASERKLGTVVHPWKGTYGFIEPDEELSSGERKHLFFHQMHIKMEGYRIAKPGDRVTFEVGENHQGPMAVNVLVEDDAPPAPSANETEEG